MLPAVVLAYLLAPPPPNVADLLRRVSETYSTLATFDFEARTSRIDPGEMHLANHIRYARDAGGRYYYSFQGTSLRQIVSDGTRVYAYFSSDNSYSIEDPGSPLELTIEQQQNAHIERYANLDRLTANARFLRFETLKRPHARIEAAVVQIEVKSLVKTGFRSTLWIDPERAVILRAEYADYPQTNLRERCDYLRPPGLQPPDPSLFDFNPPKDARRRP